MRLMGAPGPSPLGTGETKPHREMAGKPRTRAYPQLRRAKSIPEGCWEFSPGWSPMRNAADSNPGNRAITESQPRRGWPNPIHTPAEGAGAFRPLNACAPQEIGYAARRKPRRIAPLILTRSDRPVPHPFHSLLVKWVGNHEPAPTLNSAARNASRRDAGNLAQDGVRCGTQRTPILGTEP